MTSLEGLWRVERESGLLPPFGLSKRMADGRGATLVGPVPVASFRVEGTTLVYARWPVRDELSVGPDGTWRGRGLFLGREFCRFRLVRATEGAPPAV